MIMNSRNNVRGAMQAVDGAPLSSDCISIARRGDEPMTDIGVRSKKKPHRIPGAALSKRFQPDQRE
ncbi:MAG: hypothetical protein RIC16_07045 [Rhodospirillales bacterium]